MPVLIFPFKKAFYIINIELLKMIVKVVQSFSRQCIQHMTVIFLKVFSVLHVIVQLGSSGVGVCNMTVDGKEQTFSSLEYQQSRSVSIVQRHFRKIFRKDPPNKNIIVRWYAPAVNTRCTCKKYIRFLFVLEVKVRNRL